MRSLPPLYLLCFSCLLLSSTFLGFQHAVLLSFGILKQQVLFRICTANNDSKTRRRVFSISEAVVVSQLSSVAVCLAAAALVVANMEEETHRLPTSSSAASTLFWAPLVVGLSGNICLNYAAALVVPSSLGNVSRVRLAEGIDLWNVVLFPLAVLAWLAGTSIPDAQSPAATSSFTAITWAFHFIFAGKNHLIVISCWAVLVVVMLWFITKEASSCHQKLSSHQRLTPDVSCWWTFRLSLCRKYFHVLIVAICGVAVALKTVELLIFAILGALWLFIYVELIRVCCPDSLLGQRLTPFLHLFSDKRDDGCIAITHIYLLVGVGLPLVVEFLESASEQYNWPRASIGIITIGVGDAMAAVVGVRYGKHLLPMSTHKTYEGLIAFLVSSGLASALLLPSPIQWRQLVINAIVVVSSGLYEAYSHDIDNLMVPVFAHLVYRCADYYLT
eukprot:GHVS01105706.1.p1 GENE.GHVS01105706.1~~GHVS01105706.1.p1  ORF type:complete len:445 (-),score=58.46 GHVS01105706.1:977-2311(-)